jgi:hypothetical protein
MASKLSDKELDALLDGAPPSGEDAREEGFQFGEMKDNLWDSGIKLGEGMYNALSNPSQTLKGMQGMASGYAQILAGGDSPSARYSKPENVALANAVTEDYGTAYKGIMSGDFDQTLQTLEDDPFRVASDFSGLISGGAGTLGKGLSLASKVPAKTSLVAKALKTAGTGAEKVANAATYLDPVNDVARIVTKSIIPTEFLYKHALLNSGGAGALDPYQLERAARKGLDEKIRLTHTNNGKIAQGTPFEGGNEKLRRLVRGKQGEQKAIVSGMDDIPLEEMYTNIDDLSKRKGTIGGSTNPLQDQGRVDTLAGTHRAAALTEYPEGMVPSEVVQQVKQTFGDRGRNAYNASVLDPELGVDAQAYAAIADSSREALSKRSPLAGELDSVNRQLQDLRYVQGAVDPAALRKTKGGIVNVDLGSRALANAAGVDPSQSAIIGAIASKAGQKTGDVALLAKYLREGQPRGTVARSATAASGRVGEEAERRQKLDELAQLLYGDQ